MLDTWFSSQLWPFATLGWPEQTDRLKTFYPTTVLSTARDIIYLWVARMIMMGFEFMGDVPFRDVIIHPTVLAADGRRMSKSLGTGVDPLELIADYGADATRFGLAYMSSVQDVRFSAERIEMGRNFANKIWNASRLILQGADPAAGSAEGGPRVELATPADRWIFSRLAAVGAEAASLYEAYEFDDVARLLYRFVWNEVCDWYLEIAKTRLYSEDEAERAQVSGNLLALLESVMILLHPVMPFVTEEIYSFLPQVASGQRPASLFDASYPEARPEWADPAAEAAMEAFTAVVAGLRSAREELGLARDVVGKVTLAESTPGAAAALVGLPGAFRQLCGCEIVAVLGEGQQPAGALRLHRGAGRQGHARPRGPGGRGARSRAAGEQGPQGARRGCQGPGQAAEPGLRGQGARSRGGRGARAPGGRRSGAGRGAPALRGAGRRAAVAARGGRAVSTCDPREVWEYVNGLERLGTRLGLERVRKLVEALGSPQTAYRTIHVVGTNGKTSTTRFISALLQAQGHRVGAYTSPHLISLAERQMVDSIPSTDEEFCDLVARIRPVVDELEKTFEPGECLTQFEVLTAAAFLYFKEQGCDVAVIEAGLGGRLDATAVISSEVQVLTSIGLEHTELLGDTPVRHPQGEGGGDTRRTAGWSPGCWRPTSRPSSRSSARPGRRNATSSATISSCSPIRAASRSTSSACYGCYMDVRLKVLGGYQRVNAAVAVAAVELFTGGELDAELVRARPRLHGGSRPAGGHQHAAALHLRRLAQPSGHGRDDALPGSDPRAPPSHRRRVHPPGQGGRGDDPPPGAALRHHLRHPELEPPGALRGRAGGHHRRAGQGTGGLRRSRSSLGHGERLPAGHLQSGGAGDRVADPHLRPQAGDELDRGRAAKGEEIGASRVHHRAAFGDRGRDILYRSATCLHGS